MRWLRVHALSTLLLAGACAPSKSSESPAKAAAAPLHLGPLTDYVPAAGLRWMLVGNPRSIAQNTQFREDLSLLLPPERLNAFTEGSGVDLRQVESGLIAGFDFGTLYVVTPPRGSSATIVALFRERIVSGEQHQFPHPQIERIYGLIGNTPELLVRVDDHLIAIATHDPTPARVVEAFARMRLKSSPPALRGAALSTLTAPPADAVATFYAPGPFAGEWARGARGLLANALSARISLVPLPPDRARFVMELTGEFPPSGADDLAQAFSDLRASPLGKLLGIDQEDSQPRVHEREQRLLMEVDLKIAPIVRGLRAAVVSDVWEIMQLPH
ncbi:MAG: hypothetical protein ACOY0T_39250 [Myxococcota bacterium]